ncbi:MAG: hypothetical protein CM15mP48_0140 [Candidatus Poseidoniales archaeon]|nr:MAG: hypothetical protein CM15mP48_0140 [Candidatus Poseidoniales archaeon]
MWYELWEREKISILLGEAELEKKSAGNDKTTGRKRHPDLSNDFVVPQQLELKRALENTLGWQYSSGLT